MANEGEVDPQWLCKSSSSNDSLGLTMQGILPEEFELTEAAKLKSLQYTEITLPIEDNFLVSLNHIANLPRTKDVGYTFIPIEKENIVKAEYDMFQTQWIQHHNSIEQKAKQIDLAQYVRYKCMFVALCHVGLDYRGGLVEFVAGEEVLMPYILVKDAEKARKYVNIGVHIGIDIPEHPTTLKDAAIAYAKVSTLITEYLDAEDVRGFMEEAHENEDCWWAKRQLFWYQTRERYRQALLDLAKEECYENEVRGSCLLSLCLG